MKITPRKLVLEASPYLFILPFVIFCLILLLYPVVYSLALSFREATVETFVSGEMPFNGLTQYQAALADPIFWRALTNTLLFAFFSILFQFTIGFLLALLFQADFPWKNFCLAALLVPWVSPILTAANIFKGLFNEVGPINRLAQLIGLGPFPWLADPSYALPATIVANIWIGFPFNFILLYAGMRSIPEDVYEAAKIDGAGFWQRVGFITLPMLKPVTVAVLMLGTIYTVKVFDIVWIMTGGGPANGTHLLSTYAYQVGFSVLNFGEAAAIATLLVLLVLLLNLVQFLLQRGR
ncbi:MAG: sugar ABC transporter permease [Terrimicrobium sp.]|jgi:multiple sugar transport system permease protein|nr:sugar ABC transporter permease [Terrimicrobiaceae bacterium]